MPATPTAATFGDVLRTWRQRRRLSQLDLAIEADVSARHVSFMETGCSTVSRRRCGAAQRAAVALHPEGLAPRIKNLGQWRHHLVDRLRREVAASGSGKLTALVAELTTHPGPSADSPDSGHRVDENRGGA